MREESNWIVFLDIDGVLNSVAWQESRPKREEGVVLPSRVVWERMLDPAAVTLLNGLLERTGAKVVVSSSWRTMTPLPEIVSLLQARGFTGEVFGQTPDLNGPHRWEEILHWLRESGPAGACVVLDDDPMPAACECHVRTDYRVGLTTADVEKAEALLNGCSERENTC